MITYLTRLKEKIDRQAGSDFLKRIIQYQGSQGLVNFVNISLNALKQKHPGKVNYLPPCLFIEITNRCNLSCPTCMLGTEAAYVGYNKNDLTFDQFKFIVDQIPSLIYVTLQGVGEPLLNKDIMKMIQYCTSKGIYTYINTNGTILTETKSQELIQSGLKNLSISVNSFDEKIFSETRSGASIHKVEENVRRFIEIKKNFGSERPIVSFRAILMKETEPYMEELVFKSNDLGVDILYIQPFMSMVADREYMKSTLSDEDIESFSNKIEKWKKEIKMQIITEGFGVSSNNFGQCNLPWFSPNITAEGYITPCCTISNQHIMNLGNVFETSFSELWNSERFIEFRNSFYSKQPSVCYGCPSYKTESVKVA